MFTLLAIPLLLLACLGRIVLAFIQHGATAGWAAVGSTPGILGHYWLGCLILGIVLDTVLALFGAASLPVRLR